MAVVEVVDHGRWAEVILNRPERRNAINGPLGEALTSAIRRADADDGVQAILFRGAEGAFCSGLDLKAFNAEPPPDWMPRFSTIWRGAHKAIFECRKPVVVALERFAINGGAALALAADLLVAGENAFLHVGEVRQGMAAPYNLAWLRFRHSESVAAQLTLTGRRFTGSELVALGVAYAV
ncbi:MAG: enoyl-CoA hydratase/isomerase family protein, partial [Gammaproteobacteria bacterium]|nr:enoyl-CoA hydratase/isomerase family protein [Gammaproteobacteria bacterium]